MDDRKECIRVVRQVHQNRLNSSFSLLHLGFAATDGVKHMQKNLQNETQMKKAESTEIETKQETTQTEQKHRQTQNQTGRPKQRISTRKMAVSGMLGAVAIVLSVTGLGMIPMHVPVILAAVLEGPMVGAFTGFIFGLYSFMTPVGAIPADPIVRILPRILIGVTSYYTYVLFRRSRAGVVAAAIIGTLTNTIGYLGLASLIGYLPWAASLTVMITQMPFEMVLAVVLLLVLDKAFTRRG